jgi:hypothetical protein
MLTRSHHHQTQRSNDDAKQQPLRPSKDIQIILYIDTGDNITDWIEKPLGYGSGYRRANLPSPGVETLSAAPSYIMDAVELSRSPK